MKLEEKIDLTLQVGTSTIKSQEIIKAQTTNSHGQIMQINYPTG